MHTKRLTAEINFPDESFVDIAAWLDSDSALVITQNGSIYVPKDAVKDFVQSLQKLAETGR